MVRYIGYKQVKKISFVIKLLGETMATVSTESVVYRTRPQIDMTNMTLDTSPINFAGVMPTNPNDPSNIVLYAVSAALGAVGLILLLVTLRYCYVHHCKSDRGL
jgi:hypothetical protein